MPLNSHNNPYIFLDPDGKFGVVGGLIGFTVEAGFQMQRGELSVTGLLVATGVGAVTGGVGGSLTARAGQGAISTTRAATQTAVAGSAASTTGLAVTSIVEGEAPTVAQIGMAAGTGAVGAGVGSRLALAHTRKLEKLRAAGGVNAHIADATASARRSGEGIVSVSEAMLSGGVDFAAQIAGKALIEKD